MPVWFDGEPEIEEVPVRTFRQRWRCPMAECDGEMIATGEQYLTDPPGHFHQCNKCGEMRALRGARFPREYTREE